MKFGAGPPATPLDRERGQESVAALGAEISTIRETALAWRNGLAAMLAGLLGFGLIRGRSDVSLLAKPFAIVAGVVLLASLIVGVYGGLMLLRAAHGYPSNERTVGAVARRLEADAALLDMRRGLACSIVCGALLVLAVGVTWYGPGTEPRDLEVRIPGEAICGSVARVDNGDIVMKVDGGERRLAVSSIVGIRPVDSC